MRNFYLKLSRSIWKTIPETVKYVTQHGTLSSCSVKEPSVCSLRTMNVNCWHVLTCASVWRMQSLFTGFIEWGERFHLKHFYYYIVFVNIWLCYRLFLFLFITFISSDEMFTWQWSVCVFWWLAKLPRNILYWSNVGFNVCLHRLDFSINVYFLTKLSWYTK